MLDWTVPGYRAVRELRRGTSATGLGERTVLGTHLATGLPVLLRHLDGTLPEADLDARRADARLLAAVRDAHVAHLYEWVETDLGVALVRQYVPGASVRSVLRGSRLAPAAGLVTLRAGLLGLAAAHEQGLAHRGYKPENLLVDAEGTVRLADFAASRPPHSPVDPSATATPDGPAATAGGEPAPPARRDGFDDERARDVRAAFATFVAAVTGGDNPDKLPRKLRGLAGAAAALDGAALLAALEPAARAAIGADWHQRGARELASLVAKAQPTSRKGQR